MSDSAEHGGTSDGDAAEGASLVQAAWKAVQQGQVEEAERLYRNALDMLESEYGGDHQHIATCLESIGDVCSAQDKFEEAEQAYLQALEMKERLLGKESPAFVGTLYKLAKIYESRSMLDEAEYVYKQAMPVAKEILLPGHPLLNNLVDGYAAILKRRQRRTEKVAEIIEGLARTNRERLAAGAGVGADDEDEGQEGSLEALVKQQHQSSTSLPAQDTEQKADAKQRRQSAGRLRKAASPIAGMTAGVLGAILTIGIAFGGAYFAFLKPKPAAVPVTSDAATSTSNGSPGGESSSTISPPSNSVSPDSASSSSPSSSSPSSSRALPSSGNLAEAIVPGKVFVSLDDKTAITVISSDQLELRSDSIKSQLKYNLATPHWSEQIPFLGVLSGSKTGKAIFRLSDDALIDNNGKALYPQGSPELSIKDGMLKIASAVQKYYFLRNEYPPSVNVLNSLDVSYTNPVTGRIELPDLQILKSEQGWDPRRPGEKSALETAFENGGTWPGEPPLKPGVIHCFVMCTAEPAFEKVLADPSLASRGLVFVIHGTDAQGRLLPSTDRSKSFLVVLKEGKTINNLEQASPTASRQPMLLDGDSITIKSGD